MGQAKFSLFIPALWSNSIHWYLHSLPPLPPLPFLARTSMRTSDESHCHFVLLRIINYTSGLLDMKHGTTKFVYMLRLHTYQTRTGS